MAKFDLNNVSFGVVLLCAILVVSAVAVEWYTMAVLYAIIGISSLFMGSETARKAVYGITHRFNGNYTLVEDDAVAVALAQAKADAEASEAKAEAADEATVANAEAAAWRDLMITHVISACGLLSLDYDLICGLGLTISVEYNAAGEPVVRVK